MSEHYAISGADSSSVRTVLITGASSGIGRATALALDRAGYRVLAGVRRPEDATALKAAAGRRRLETIILDVTVKDDIEAASLKVSEITDNQGLVALINNAGINYSAAYEYTDQQTKGQAHFASTTTQQSPIRFYTLKNVKVADLRR